MENIRKVTISVRNLVEFILNAGDIDNRYGRRDSMEAMQQGSKLHRKIQKSMGSGYQAEVMLRIAVEKLQEGEWYEINVEGRADGIFQEEDLPVIDEIKGVYMELAHITDMIPVHRAQAMCYAYIYAKQCSHERIGIRLTYCNIESEQIKYFDEKFTLKALEDWFDKLTCEYCKWAAWQYQWRVQMQESCRGLAFPFPYRSGQKDLVAGVYKTILREKKLFIEAPTGVGKTISTVYPSVMAMGEGQAEKIFYTTAKTITRTVAEDTFGLLIEKGLKFKVVTITAKEKICILEKPDCNPVACERAGGHFDRVNDAVYDMLTHETRISRELIQLYAKKHRVCPFEMSLDVTLWADAVICDYNYIFDPNVYLRRFFANEKPQKFVFLIDEAHNLVERAREMYSATLYKEDFLTVKKLIGDRHKNLVKCLERCNSDFLIMKRECDDCEVFEDINGLALHLQRLMAEFDEYLQEKAAVEDKETIVRFYLDVRHFVHMYELLDENYLIYADYDETARFRVKLMCMDPSRNLLQCLNKGKSAVFFSATLLPIRYYKEQLGGKEEDYAVYAPSPFSTDNRLLMVGSDVSTKYNRRTDSEYERIVQYIECFTAAKVGNYFVFFPSYAMLQSVAELAGERLPGLVLQTSSMTEEEKERFLTDFAEETKATRIGFCVMGGIFSEGIDLKNDRLIGAVIVGTGLPMVCNERELFRGFYDERSQSGFEYAYLYVGMNKVLQSAGRVIRTIEDKGAILLLDERFLNRQYQELFPREWFPFETVQLPLMEQKLKEFWND